MPARDVLSAAILAEFSQVHARFRDLANDLDEERLNRPPRPGENSIAVLAQHALGSERSLLYAAIGTKVDRDRDAEFRGTLTPADLRALFDANDAFMAEAGAAAAQRAAVAGDEQAPGSRRTIGWLVMRALTHTAEHLAQAELTRTLLAAQGA